MKESFKVFKPGDQIEIDFERSADNPVDYKEREERLEIAKQFGADPEKLIKNKKGKFFIIEDFSNKIVPIEIWYKRKQKEQQKKLKKEEKEKTNEIVFGDDRYLEKRRKRDDYLYGRRD
jgi:hypothetical protein